MWAEDTATIRNRLIIPRQKVLKSTTISANFSFKQKMRNIFHMSNQVFFTELTAETSKDQNLALIPEVIIFHLMLLFFQPTGLLNTKPFCLSCCDLKVYSGEPPLHVSLFYTSPYTSSTYRGILCQMVLKKVLTSDKYF